MPRLSRYGSTNDGNIDIESIAFNDDNIWDVQGRKHLTQTS
jgi:hypothetical protein